MRGMPRRTRAPTQVISRRINSKMNLLFAVAFEDSANELKWGDNLRAPDHPLHSSDIHAKGADPPRENFYAWDSQTQEVSQRPFLSVTLVGHVHFLLVSLGISASWATAAAAKGTVHCAFKLP
jgi:hypothetical protein